MVVIEVVVTLRVTQSITRSVMATSVVIVEWVYSTNRSSGYHVAPLGLQNEQVSRSNRYPGLAPWATFGRPFGAELAEPSFTVTLMFICMFTFCVSCGFPLATAGSRLCRRSALHRPTSADFLGPDRKKLAELGGDIRLLESQAFDDHFPAIEPPDLRDFERRVDSRAVHARR